MQSKLKELSYMTKVNHIPPTLYKEAFNCPVAGYTQNKCDTT
jgi:hypothetical protein